MKNYEVGKGEKKNCIKNKVKCLNISIFWVKNAKNINPDNIFVGINIRMLQELLSLEEPRRASLDLVLATREHRNHITQILKFPYSLSHGCNRSLFSWLVI